MNVAFVYPEVLDLARFKEKRMEFPPFGVLYLAATLEALNINVTIFKISEGNTFLNLLDYDVVAYSIPSSATYGIIKESRFTSLFPENVFIMVGGVHANFYPEETLLDIKPDIVGIGEGEETIVEILSMIDSKYFSSIDGVCFIKDGKPYRTKPRYSRKDIDYLPLPARHLLQEDDFLMNNRLSNTDIRMAHVMFTRGCPFPCRFCAAARTKMQFRSGASAYMELKHLVEKYRVEGFAIVDDNFIVNKAKVLDICRSIEDLNLKWSALSRVDTIDEELLLAMRDSGCIEVKYGIESGSEFILKQMDKKISQEQVIKAVTTTYELGIKTKAFLIHGYPGENMETTDDTLRLLDKISHMIERVSLFRFVPLPGTYVYENGSQFNLRNTDRDTNWDGNWGKYHIHHNDIHWWGSEADFEIMNRGYEKLKNYVDAKWLEIY